MLKKIIKLETIVTMCGSDDAHDIYAQNATVLLHAIAVNNEEQFDSQYKLLLNELATYADNANWIKPATGVSVQKAIFAAQTDS